MIDSFKGQYRFLSNFYPSEITINEITYPTVEHYFQAMKTENIEIRKEIAKATTPGIAKRMGRKLLLRKDWENIKIGTMLQGLLAKFKDPNLNKRLLATFPETLIKRNTRGDKYWGVCDGEGLNLLGSLLMLTRKLLHKENKNGHNNNHERYNLTPS
jgi:ribA/ribD-fused uncharacterized protein